MLQIHTVVLHRGVASARPLSRIKSFNIDTEGFAQGLIDDLAFHASGMQVVQFLHKAV
jgi:hypothetical protein